MRIEFTRFASGIEGYSAVVLSSADEIHALQPLVRSSLPQKDALLDPEFFLASVSQRWAPRFVTVRSGSELAAIVCAKERVIYGVGLGIVYADLSFGSILLGNELQRQEAFFVALRTLLACEGTRAVRLIVRVPSPELAAVRRLQGCKQVDTHFSRARHHASLSLPSTYEDLLLRFGYTTRHNFRYYRRRFESAGHFYLENLSPDALGSAAYYLAPKCRTASHSHSIDRLLRMTATADRPLAVGLKHRNGEWVSIVGGVYRPESAVLLFQLNNDREYPRESLSVVLRSYLLEALIRKGTKRLIIWGGTGGALWRYAHHEPTLRVYLDSPGYMWRTIRKAVSKFGFWMPERLKQKALWILPRIDIE